MMKKCQWPCILLVMMTACLIAGVFVTSFFMVPRLFTLEEPVVLDSGWKYEWEDTGESGVISLPTTLPSPLADRRLHLSNRLPDAVFKNACLFMRTSQQRMEVYVNGSIVYEYTGKTGTGIRSPGSLFHFINLPNNYYGGAVDIYLTSPYKQNSGIVNEMRLGNSISHVLHIVSSYSVNIVLSAAICLLGLLLIIIFLTLYFSSGKFYNIFYLGLFSLLSGLWLLCESRVIELFVQNPIILLICAFVSQFLMPIPLLAFIISTYDLKNKGWLKSLMYLFMGFFAAASLLHLFHLVEYIDIMPVFHVLVAGTIATILTLGFKELRKGDKAMKFFLVGCFALCVFSLLDIFLFYFSAHPRVHAQTFFQAGMLIFVVITTVSLAQNIIMTREKQISHDILMSLAFTDILTGFKNRTAFEGRMSELNKNLERYTSIHLGILDINGLKSVNDTYGHKEGDKLIMEGAAIIHETFGGVGDLFRIGGDEFAVIITDVDSYFVCMEIDQLYKKISDYNQTSQKTKISIACGFDSYVPENDKDLQSVFIRADKAMYLCKENQKSSENN